MGDKGRGLGEGRGLYLGGVLGVTHPEKLEAFESLAGDNGDELHFAEKGNFWWCEAGRECKCHVPALRGP